MVKTTSSQTGEPGGAWAGFQASFLQLFAELLKCSPEIDSLRKSAASGTQPGAENLKKLVTEAVGAVLIESQLIEKLVARALRNSQKEGGAGAGAGGVGEGEAAVSNENLRQACEQIFQEYVDQRLIQSLQKEIRQVVQNKLLEFGNSEAFKALLDGRFRIMENYLRGEVIPKAIERHLEKGTA